MKIQFYIIWLCLGLCTSIQHTQYSPKLCTSIQRTPKLCVECKFYVKPFLNRKEFGKCSFLFKQNFDTYFVTEKNNTEYNYCSTARKYDHLCGEEGKHYKPNF